MVVITALLTAVLYIISERILDFLRKDKKPQQTASQQILKVMEIEIREYGKARIINDKEKREAFEYLELELNPKIHGLQAQIANLETITQKFLRIHNILLIFLFSPLFFYSFVYIGIINAGNMFLSPAFWIMVVIGSLDLILAFSIANKRWQKHFELMPLIHEALDIYKYKLREMEPSSIVKSFVRLVAEGNSISPYLVAAGLKTLGVNIDGDDLAIAIISHGYPTEHEQQEFFVRVLKRKTGLQIQYRELPESEKERILSQIQKEFR